MAKETTETPETTETTEIKTTLVSEENVMSPPAVSNETEQQVTLVRLQNGTCIPIYLWRRSISFLTVREQAVSVRGISCFFRKCSDEYMKNFWLEPTVCLHVPQDASSLARAMEMCQYLTRQEEYVEGTTVVVELGIGVHEVIGSCRVPDINGTCQHTLSVPIDNLSFVGKGEGETIVHGTFVVVNVVWLLHVAGLTMKNPSGYGLAASGVGTKIIVQNVTVEDCQYDGVFVWNGAELVATDCHFRQNGGCGVNVYGSTATARLTSCTSHHNKKNGVLAESGAVVDLMGEGTSVHDNRDGLSAFDRGSTINVYQPCVLNDMSHGNKGKNIMKAGGTVQQKDSKK